MWTVSPPVLRPASSSRSKAQDAVSWFPPASSSEVPMHYETRPYLSAHDDQGSTETLSADALLRAYGIESSFFFATPSSTWLGRGILANLSIQPSTPLDEALTRMFGQAQERGVQRPVAVGALPFDPEAAPILYI